MNEQTPYSPYLVRFVNEEEQSILSDSLSYKVDCEKIKKVYEEIVNWHKDRLSETKAEKKAEIIALDRIREALRFMSFTLADNANHRQAKACAYLNNIYRTKYWLIKRNIQMFLVTKILCLSTGYLEKPSRIIITALGACLLFAIFFGCISIAIPGYTAIRLNSIADSNCLIKPYHYVYFSAVTLTTLGYGDFSPNHSPSHPIANFLTVLLCSLEAVLGYVILGLGVATLMRCFDSHPFADMAAWMRAYKKRLNKTTH